MNKRRTNGRRHKRFTRYNLVEQDVYVRNQNDDGTDFIFDMRNLLVRHTDQERRRIPEIRFFDTVLQNQDAQRIGNFKAINQIYLSIEKRVEKKKIQHPIQNDRQSNSLELVHEASDQTLMKLPQIMLNRDKNLFRMIFNK